MVNELGAMAKSCAAKFVDMDQVMRSKFKGDCLKHITEANCPKVEKMMGSVVGALCRRVTAAGKQER